MLLMLLLRVFLVNPVHAAITSLIGCNNVRTLVLRLGLSNAFLNISVHLPQGPRQSANGLQPFNVIKERRANIPAMAGIIR